MGSARRPRLVVILLLAFPGCATWSERVREYRAAWHAGDFAAAEARIDHLLEDETGLDADVVAAPSTLARTAEAAAGDAPLLLLEKGMTRLARGDAAGAIDLLRRARDALDEDWRTDAVDYVQAALLDDAAIEFAGADYEHVLVRVMLALADLIAGDGDALAYAHQIGAKQEEILHSDFGAEQGYEPRKQYQRVAIGAYLEGVLHETRFAAGDAALAYERALRYGGDDPLIAAALERTRAGTYAPPGHGVLHVFRLVGRGPHLVEGVHPPTDLANRLAGVAVTLLTDRGAALVQTPVEVPVVAVSDPNPPELEVAVPDAGRTVTVTLLDVNQVAVEQLDANLPWILARALVRRSLKATAAAFLEEGVRRRNEQAVAFLVAALVNLAATAAEQADTRSWSSLPAAIQVARLPLPEGVHDVRLGAHHRARVAVAAGHDSYVLMIQPSPARPGGVLVDVHSRVAESVEMTGTPEQVAPASRVSGYGK